MRIYVPLPRHVKDALLALAEHEDRDPNRQAARLIEEALIGKGFLTGPLGAYPNEPQVQTSRP